MKQSISFLLLLLLLAACSKPSVEEVVKQTVERNYQALLSGHYELFLSGRADTDRLPADYRSQLLDSYRQFMAQQQAAHGGISSVMATNVQMDSTQNVMQVFLMLNYADSLHEEIVVPMVMRNGEWKMK
jgi:hypothetical protein